MRDHDEDGSLTLLDVAESFVWLVLLGVLAGVVAIFLTLALVAGFAAAAGLF